MRGIRTDDLTRKTLKSYPLHHKRLYTWSISYLIVKKLKFSAQRSSKFRDFEKISIRLLLNIALIPKLLGFSVLRPLSLGIDVK